MKKNNKWRKNVKFNGPLSLSWDITNKCNFNCIHCLNRSGDNSIHSFEDELDENYILKCIEQIIELKPEQICLCGGEPTLNKNIFTIIKKISESGISVNMVTNGSNLTIDFVKKLNLSGIKFIQISLDSHIEKLHDDFRHYKGSYKMVCEAVQNIKKQKIPFALSMCPTNFNCDVFEHYVNFVKKIGCKYIRVMPLLPMGRGLDNFLKIEPSISQYEKLKFLINRLRNPQMNIEWGDPLDHIHKAVYENRAFPINIEIKSNGDIGCSIYLPITVGNVKRHSLREYWEAGLDSIWSHPEVLKIAKNINTIEDFKKMSFRTWSILKKEIDIIDD